MGVLEDFRGNIVGLDTTPLIYFIEKNVTYHPLVRPFFVALANGQFTVVTSTITLVETLIHPIRNSHPEIARRYREILLNTSHLTTFDVSPDIHRILLKKRLKFAPTTKFAPQMPFNWQLQCKVARHFF